MKAIVFGAGLAVGFVLGARAGRGSYEQLKTRARQAWESPTVQSKVSGAASAVKDKAPEAQEHLKEAVKKAGDSISGALHRGHPEQASYTGRPAATLENPVITEPGSDRTDTD
ncbi:YtxH domain-containing protein [Arthrobacter sp. I2-34]|uniref:YtxH domain-containing protein n=1 Tax=Arthrobacter hankyongi TaxID=2904801 RepID=A0ABS9L5Q6_9MICC|nr:YtxH domain-containing protein [Arthrobacter hankyongi]MCG2621809.1 YtxH domain-containing protein [Arthrobacter hankyongi]